MPRTLTLQAGTALLIWCAHCRPNPKWKYYVIAYLDPVPRYFIINTRPAQFQRDSEELMAHQVSLPAKPDHDFLDHDSVLDCTQVCGGPTVSELEDQYAKDPTILLGRVSVNARRAVRRVAKESELLSGREIESILAIW